MRGHPVSRAGQSETSTKAEALAMETKLIRETGANNPEIGYNLRPRWSG
jgi:hypothetical protein